MKCVQTCLDYSAYGEEEEYCSHAEVVSRLSMNAPDTGNLRYDFSLSMAVTKM